MISVVQPVPQWHARAQPPGMIDSIGAAQAVAFASALGADMPEISRFRGIVITMYFNDHDPPHFHVRYGEFRATVGIETPELLGGWLPRPVLSLVVVWARLHQHELLGNWTTLARSGTFVRIAPLT